MTLTFIASKIQNYIRVNNLEIYGLTTLALDGNGLSEDDFDPLWKELFRAQGLTSLDVSRNEMRKVAEFRAFLEKKETKLLDLKVHYPVVAASSTQF